MTLPKINKNILLIVALVVIIGAAYFTFFRDPAPEEGLVSVETNPALSGVGGELIIELNRLKALGTVNKDIFSDPVFVSLKDFTQVVEPEPLGRGNPFAPIGN